MAEVIVFGASPTGLAVMRALGRRGIRCHVADMDSARHCFHSRYRKGEPITGVDADEVVARASQVVERLSGRPVIAIPTSDVMVLALGASSAVRDGKLVTYKSISSGLAAEIVDKKSFAEKCQRVGIDIPTTVFPETANDIERASDGFLYPLLLKPIIGHLWRERLAGKKVLIAQSRDELSRIVETIGDDCRGLMVQELIPGPETDIQVGAIFRSSSGERFACFTAEKTRQNPPNFGTATLATSRWNEKVAEQSWRFVEGIDYRGICGTEFKFDRRDGKYKMIEVNPRPTLWFHLVAAAGVELIYAAYADLVGAKAVAVKQQSEEVRWCYLEKDLLTWQHHLTNRDIPVRQLLGALSPRNHHAVASLADPGPLFSSPRYYVRRLWQRLRYRQASEP